MYSKDNPKWVQATSAKSEGDRYVTVTAYGETFTHCKMQWSDPFMHKTKSDALVQNSQGDWLRVWFYDKDILP